MKEKMKLIWKRSKFPFIMCIITFLIGCFLAPTCVGMPIMEKLIILIINFLPFIVFTLITLLYYFFRDKRVFKVIFDSIMVILIFLLFLYYFIAIFMCTMIAAFNPITDIKYYNYQVGSSYLTQIFPKKIPKNVNNVQFYYAPGILQGGTNYSLYYIDNTLTKEKFDEKYKEKAIWIGYKNEYKEMEGLLTGAFSFTPVEYENEKNYIIYLIDGNCDDSGYCNHGRFLLVAYNEETNEVIFRSEDW